MKQLTYKTTILLFILCMLFVYYPGIIYANNAELIITASPKVVHQGDILTINVTFSSKEAIGPLTAGLAYNNTLLDYKSGGGNSVQLSNGTGGISDNGSQNTKKLSYTFNFLAKKTGKASFQITDSEVVSYNSGVLLGNPTDTISINIGKPEEEKTEIPSDLPENNEPIELSINGKTMYLSKVLPEIKLPQDFELSTLTYEGRAVEGAINTSTGMLLLYVMNSSDKGSWYIYDSTGLLYPYITIQVNEAYTWLPMDIEPVGYQPTVIQVEGQETTVLKPNRNFQGFYLVKAINEQDIASYYFYDEVEGTMQRIRLNTSTVQNTADNLENTKDSNELLRFTADIIGVCFILIIINILIYVHYKTKKNKL